MTQAHDAHAAGDHGHVVPSWTFLKVWLVLLCLTDLLVAVSRWKHEELSVYAMLTVTPVKAALVFWYFMHLKYEKTLFRTMLFITLAALIVFLALLFFDVFNR
jgi:cytochrome c oxidase subunit IV